ncbi:MAG: LysR family transcriptional regulator [Deltaproteobacteria bacterium]|nr:LysR family transcriptional regulator [Deltaproteobacteria bacterium]MDQ3298023.1 LysR family transcriptional regulator [Myxococcota bacterium]
MRLAGIDLNLLTSLDALLDERNVTRAAKRLGVTQPAVSHSLRRLRDLLGDPLLVRTRNGMTATPRAVALRPAVRAALEAAEVVLRAVPPFDAAMTERTFSLVMADQASFLLLPPLLERLAREAPGIAVQVRPASRDPDAEDVDLAIGVFRDAPAGVHQLTLWREDFVCVLRKGSAAARGTFDRKRYLALGHLLVAPRGMPGSPLDDVLARTGDRRRVMLTVPHFLVAPHVVATTDLVWTAPASLARAFAEQLPLVLRDPPLRLEGFTIALRWHARLASDPGLAWLRSVVQDVAPRA